MGGPDRAGRSPPWRPFLAGLAAGGAAGAWAALRRREGAAGGPAAAQRHPAAAFGLPVGERLRVHEGFVAAWDPRTRNPAWVAERITAGAARGPADRDRSRFVEDAAIPARFRSRLEDFRGSGYDRGHLAPAANHKRSQRAMDETFRLSNVSPQVGAGFNRNYWARFERFVQDFARVADEVFVVTGPLYLPGREPGPEGGFRMGHRLLGRPPRLVQVPTHFFKVVLGEVPDAASGRPAAALGAFVMPNAKIPADAPLADFLVRLEDLESASGLQFFPRLPEHLRREVDGQVGRFASRANAGLLPGPAAEEGGEGGEGGEVAVPGPPAGAAVHLCAATKCDLPAADWYLKGKKKRTEGGGGGGAGERKALTRLPKKAPKRYNPFKE